MGPVVGEFRTAVAVLVPLRELTVLRVPAEPALHAPLELLLGERVVLIPIERAELAMGHRQLGEFDERPVRKLGVRVSNLDFSAGEQASLGGFEGAADSSRGSASENRDGTATASETATADSEPTEDGQASLTAFDGDEPDTEGDDADGPTDSEGSADGQASLGDFE